MIKFIRDRVGRRTMPANTYRHKTTGEYFVKGHYTVPSINDDIEHFVADTDTYYWREIKQNKLGAWQYCDTYVSSFAPMDMLFVSRR